MSCWNHFNDTHTSFVLRFPLNTFSWVFTASLAPVPSTHFLQILTSITGATWDQLSSYSSERNRFCHSTFGRRRPQLFDIWGCSSFSWFSFPSLSVSKFYQTKWLTAADCMRPRQIAPSLVTASLFPKHTGDTVGETEPGWRTWAAAGVWHYILTSQTMGTSCHARHLLTAWGTKSRRSIPPSTSKQPK